MLPGRVERRHGLAVLPGSSLDVTGSSGAFLRIPFLAAPDELADATRRLAAAWQGYSPSPAPTPALPRLAV